MPFYMKQLKEAGDWEVKELDAQGKSGDEVLRDVYLADNWADATQEEYDAQVANSVASDASDDEVESEEVVEESEEAVSEEEVA